MLDQPVSDFLDVQHAVFGQDRNVGPQRVAIDDRPIVQPLHLHLICSHRHQRVGPAICAALDARVGVATQQQVEQHRRPELNRRHPRIRCAVQQLVELVIASQIALTIA